MTDSIIIERIADAALDCFYDKLIKTEDFQALEMIVALDMREVAAKVLCKCIERFDCELHKNIPKGWSVHEYAKRTILTLVGAVTFTRTIFLDEFGIRRAWTDELLGIPSRSRLSACAFLWIATHASELSYRKTAKEFFELTSAHISHVSVMNVVHKEGALLKASGAEFARDEMRISQDVLFIESDGLWVHLQESSHKDKALPRFLYEQARKTKSFELKLAALYAGKAKIGPGRYKRIGLCLTCADEDTESFWKRAWEMLCENYEQDDVCRIAVGGDGAKWCGHTHIKDIAPNSCSVDFTLDLFHVIKKIAKAFPDKDSAKGAWATNLALRGKGKQLVHMCERIADKMKAGSARDKVLELKTYIFEHIDGIRAPRHELGTMEGTNAHIGASRLKGQGRSWSRRGAEAMCLIRCAIATGRALVAPPCTQWFTKRELAIKASLLPKSASEISKSSGTGWEYPYRSKPLSKSVNISLSYRR